MLCSIAVRIIFQFGGNVNLPATADSEPLGSLMLSRARVHVRDLFWICYVVDKNLCLRTGRPPLIDDDDCDLSLPPSYLQEEPNTETPRPHFPNDLRLSIIVSKVYRELYSRRALKKSDIEILKTIRELDGSLDRWKLSLPTQQRLTIFDSPDLQKINTRYLMLRLEYYQCVTLIHQASSRCKAWVGGDGGMVEGISSSMTLSVEASRSSLLCLEMTQGKLDEIDMR